MPPTGPPAFGTPAPPYPPPAANYAPPAKTNVWAILSLVFGVFGLIGVPVSVICGIVGLRKAKQGQGGRVLAIVGLALSGLWVVGLAGIFLYYFILSGGNLFNAPKKPGDCIAEMPRGDQSVSVKAVDCSDLHEGEVVAVLTMPDGDVPGRAGYEEYREKCALELAIYAPATVEDPDVGLFVRYPTEELWANGHRDVVCAATFDPPRTGSIKGLADERTAATGFLKVGDCLGEPTAGTGWPLLDCEDPHTGEVFAVLMLPDGAFPGEATVEEYKDKCEGELAAYSPDTADDRSIRVRKNFPDEKSWQLGHRSVNCIANFETPRTGSLQG